MWVWPNRKHRYPLTPMEKYITWTNGEGLPYDNWLRVHVRLGVELSQVLADLGALGASLGEGE